ncbi:MAG: hypothetical protein ACI9H6_000413 [Patiriisocius sp.]|jgi:hypothetical protein
MLVIQAGVSKLVPGTNFDAQTIPRIAPDLNCVRSYIIVFTALQVYLHIEEVRV